MEENEKTEQIAVRVSRVRLDVLTLFFGRGHHLATANLSWYRRREDGAFQASLLRLRRVLNRHDIACGLQ